MNNLLFGLFNLGEDQILLIAAITFLLLVGTLTLVGLVYLIFRMIQKRSYVRPLHSNHSAQ